MMGGIRVCGCVGASQRIPLFWHETHTKGFRARFPTRPEEYEGRKVPERTEETSGQKEAVRRTGQSAGESSQQKSKEADG